MTRALLLLAGLALSGCEGGGDPVEQALREEAAANHAEVALAREAQDQREAATAEAETRRLTREIAVAEAALNGSQDPEVRAAAQQTIDANQRALERLGAEG